MDTIINTLDIEFNRVADTYRGVPIIYNTKWAEYRVTDESGEVIFLFKTINEARDHIDATRPARSLCDRLLVAARREGRF